jgi:hypothetical protein
MIKLRRAIFCYYILRLDRRLHAWILCIRYSRSQDSLLAAGANERNNLPSWFTVLLDKKLDFDAVLKILSGDAFYERNKSDVALLQSEVGRPVTEIWDTHPVFAKYPHLRMLARNKEFEEMWPKLKAEKNKDKQK